MSAHEAHLRWQRLAAERVDVVEAGLGDNALYMADLEHELSATREAYVGLAVIEIASFRGRLSGLQVG